MAFNKDLDFDLAVLMRNLQIAETGRDLNSLRSYIFEVLHLSNNGCDVSCALPSVVKLLAHSDVFIKRVAGELIATYADSNPQIVLLATNTLVQDSCDLNPVIRSLSLKILASLVHSLQSPDLLNKVVSQSLEDKSPIVKQCAALSCISLHQLAPSSVTESGIWDRLYQHLRDPEPGVIAGCMCALETIFAKEKGLVVSNKLGQYLINAITTYTPPVQRLVLQFLLKLSPKKKSQVFEHLNDLDEYLSQSNSIVIVLCALELFCHLSSDLYKVTDKAFATAWGALKVIIARERNEETITSVLDYMNIKDLPIKVMAKDFKIFYCRDDDAPFLIKKKSCMLSKLITCDNAENILKEFLSFVRCLDSVTFSQVLLNIFNHMEGKPDIEGTLVQFLLQLFELDNMGIIETILQILPSLIFIDQTNWTAVANCIQTYYKDIKSLEAQVAILHLLRMHSFCFGKAPEILEHMVTVIDREAGKLEEIPQSDQYPRSPGVNFVRASNLLLQLKLGALCAMVNVAQEKPAKVQHLLSHYMEQCICDKNRVVRDRALFLYGFLYSKVKQELLQTKKIE